MMVSLYNSIYGDKLTVRRRASECRRGNETKRLSVVPPSVGLGGEKQLPFALHIPTLLLASI